MTTALQILSKEHQHILKVITTLTKECDNLQTKQELNEQFFRQAIEFIRNYADKLTLLLLGEKLKEPLFPKAYFCPP